MASKQGLLARIFASAKGDCCGPVSVVPDDPSEEAANPATGPAPLRRDVFIVTGSVPGGAADTAAERAAQRVDRAVAGSGVPAQVRTVSATEATGSGLPPMVATSIQRMLGEGALQPPVVVVDGQVVTAGTVDEDAVRAALAAGHQPDRNGL